MRLTEALRQNRALKIENERLWEDNNMLREELKKFTNATPYRKGLNPIQEEALGIESDG